MTKRLSSSERGSKQSLEIKQWSICLSFIVLRKFWNSFINRHDETVLCVNLLVFFRPVVVLNVPLCVIIAKYVKYVFLALKDYLANTGSSPQTAFCLYHEEDQERQAVTTKSHSVSFGFTKVSILRTAISNITIHANI